jgi:hypothetical protein
MPVFARVLEANQKHRDQIAWYAPQPKVWQFSPQSEVEQMTLKDVFDFQAGAAT